MLDCLNDDELHTLYGYLQRIIDASSEAGTPSEEAYRLRPPRTPRSERYLSSTPSAGT